MTNAEATGAEVLDRFFPESQFGCVIHASSKVCEGSWQWQPVTSFEPGSRPALDYARLAKEADEPLIVDIRIPESPGYADLLVASRLFPGKPLRFDANDLFEGSGAV